MYHGMSVLYPYMLLDDLIGIGIQHAHNGNRLYGFYQSLVNGERTDCRRNIAAVCAAIHTRDHDVYLLEGVVDIDILPVRRGDDGNLAGGGNGSAHTVNLLHIRGTHDFQKDLIPELFVLRKVFLMEEYCFACAAAHIHAGIFFHVHI